MSPWVRKDIKTVGKKLEGQVRQVLLGSVLLPIETLEQGIAYTWACLVLDHLHVYCSALRLAQPNAGLKLVNSSCILWALQTCQVP